MKRGLVGVLLGVMLTARMGVLHNAETGFTETWYNLPMQKVVDRAASQGLSGDYWERADNMKMYGKYIIVAADWTLHPYGTEIETSRGLGLVLDTHTAKDRALVDIATTWQKGKK